jgi:hypothetical protein
MVCSSEGDHEFAGEIATQMAAPHSGPRRLILKCSLSPGDIVVMTAAVRDLQLAYPGGSWWM